MKRKGGIDRKTAEKATTNELGIELSEARMVLDMVWDTEGEGFDDYESHAASVEKAWMFWKLREKAGGFTGSESSGGEVQIEESGSSGGREPDSAGVILDDTTATRAAAWGEYLAAISGVNQHVMRLRERICGGPTRTLTPERALEFLEAESVRGGKTIRGAPDTLLWPDGSRHGRGFRFEEDSVLAELKKTGERLARDYPWKDYQATHFIVCGGVPPPLVLGVGHKSSWGKGPPAHKFNQTTITLEVAAWMPSEYVRQAYCKARENLEDNGGQWVQGLVGARQSPALRNTEVFRFVVSRAYVYFRSTEERLARLELLPWADLVKSWNAELPEDDPRRYKEAKYFKRDFHRAQLAIIDTDQGLPGIQGQPMTIEEQKEMDRRLKEAFAQSRVAL